MDRRVVSSQRHYQELFFQASKVMAILALLAFLFAPKQGHTEDYLDHTVQVHLLAHYAAGTMIAEASHVSLKHSDLKPWQRFIVEVTVACAGNLAYELVTEKEVDMLTSRVWAGGLGASLYGYQVNF